MRLMPTLLAIALACAACARDDKDPNDQAPARGSHENAVVAAASANGIEPRVLLSAAFIQSNFATDMDASGRIPGVTRTTPFGLVGNAPGIFPQDLAANARTVAKTVRDLALNSKPKEPFDWLHLTARAIVGANDTTPLATFQTRILLHELIAAYNEGFVTVLPEGEVITLRATTEPVKVEKLTPERARLLDPGQAKAEFGSFWDGAGDARTGEKYITEMPKIILRWCPGNALVCFDHLRFTTESPSHLMAHRGANGELQFVQLHPLKKDLSWYGSTAYNAVTITLTGLAGDKPENFRPEWMTWGSYGSLNRNIRRVLQAFASFLSPDAIAGDISRFVLTEDGHTPLLPTLNPVPEGRPSFALPLFWDKPFFSEILAMEDVPRENRVTVRGNERYAVFGQTEANFVFQTQQGVTQLVFSADTNPSATQGQSWELIRRSSLRGEPQDYLFQEQFVGQGMLDKQMRALRVVARDAAGRPVGMEQVRFRLQGL